MGQDDHWQMTGRITFLRFVGLVSAANRGREITRFRVPPRPVGVSQGRWRAMCRYFWKRFGNAESLRILGMIPNKSA